MVGFCLVFRCNIKQKSTISYFNEVRMADINSVIVNLVMYNLNFPGVFSKHPNFSKKLLLF